MKRIIFGLMLAMMFCTLVQGANRTVTENDGQGNKKRVIIYGLLICFFVG